ncbi:hypothetical protein K8R43_04065 [archaeon]|nr:hypothetical protein [archaeon]
MPVKDYYYEIEDQYYSLLDKLDEKGIPVYNLVDPLEERGIPTFPLLIGLVLLLLLLFIYFLVGGFGQSLTIDLMGNSIGTFDLPTIHNVLGGTLPWIDDIIPVLNIGDEITIKVNVNSNDAPLEGAKVSVVQGGWARTETTGTDGKVEFKRVPRGEATVTAKKENCSKETKTINETGEITFNLKCGLSWPGVEGCMEIDETLYKANLVGTDNKRPEQCTLAIYDNQTKTVNLDWRIDPIKNILYIDPSECVISDYVVVIDCLAHERRDQARIIIIEMDGIGDVRLNPKDTNPTDCPPGEQWDDALLECVPITNPCGDNEIWNEELQECIPIIPDDEVAIYIVVNDTNGDYLSGITVKAIDSTGAEITEGTTQDVTGTAGTATLSLKENQNFRITAEDPKGDYSTITTGEYVADETQTITITMEAGAQTTIRVIDKEDKSRISGAVVWLYEIPHTEVTNTNGEVELTLPASETFKVQVYKNYSPYIGIESSVNSGEVNIIELEKVLPIMSGNLTLTAKNYHDHEETMEGVTFKVTTKIGNVTQKSCITDSNGECYMPFLEKGDYNVYATPRMGESQHAGDVTIVAGTTTEKTFYVKPATTLLKIWVKHGNNPYTPNAMVSILTENQFNEWEIMPGMSGETDGYGYKEFEIPKNTKIKVKGTHDESGTHYSAIWGPQTITESEKEITLELKKTEVAISFSPEMELTPKDTKTGNLYFGLPYVDEVTQTKYDTILIELWVGSDGEATDPIATPILINGFNSNSLEQDDVSVLRCSKYPCSSSSCCNIGDGEQFKYLKLEIQNTDEFYEDIGTASIELELYAKEILSTDHTYVNMKGTWTSTAGDRTSENKTLINLTSGSPWTPHPPPGEGFTGHRAGYTEDPFQEKPWSPQWSTYNGSNFYLMIDAVAAGDMSTYQIKIEDQPDAKSYLMINNYNISITKQDGTQLSESKKTLNQKLPTGGYNINPVADLGNYYALEMEDTLHLKIELQAIAPTEGQYYETYIFEDYDDLKFKIIELDGENNETTEVTNITSSNRAWQTYICAPPTFIPGCGWGTINETKIEQGYLLPVWSQQGARNFQFKFTLNNIGDQDKVLDFAATGAITLDYIPQDIIVPAGSSVSTFINGTGLASTQGTLEISMGLDGGTMKLWKTANFGQVDYEYTLWTTTSMIELEEEVLTNIDSLKAKLSRNGNALEDNAIKVEFQCWEGGDYNNVKTLWRDNDYYKYETALQLEPGENACILFAEHPEIGSMGKFYHVQGMKIEPIGSDFPLHTFSQDYQEYSIDIVMINSSWLEPKNFTLDTLEFFELTEAYDMTIQVETFNQDGSTYDTKSSTTPITENITIPEQGSALITLIATYDPPSVGNEPLCSQSGFDFNGNIKITPYSQPTTQYNYNYNCTAGGSGGGWGDCECDRDGDTITTELTAADSSEIHTVNLISKTEEDLEVTIDFSEDSDATSKGYTMTPSIKIYNSTDDLIEQQTVSPGTPIIVTLPAEGTIKFQLNASIDPLEQEGNGWTCEGGLGWYAYNILTFTPEGNSDKEVYFIHTCSKTGGNGGATGELILRETLTPTEILGTDYDYSCDYIEDVKTRLCDAKQLANAIKRFKQDYEEDMPLSLTATFAFGEDHLDKPDMEKATGNTVSFNPDNHQAELVFDLQGATAITCGVISVTATRQAEGYTLLTINNDQNKPWCDSTPKKPYFFTGTANYDEGLSTDSENTKYMRFEGDDTELTYFKNAMLTSINGIEIEDVLGYHYKGGADLEKPGTTIPPIHVIYNDLNCTEEGDSGPRDYLDCPKPDGTPVDLAWLQQAFREQGHELGGYYHYVQDNGVDKFYIGLIYSSATLTENSDLNLMRRLLVGNLMSHWTIGNNSCIQDEEEELILRGSTTCGYCSSGIYDEILLEEYTTTKPSTTTPKESVGKSPDHNSIGIHLKVHLDAGKCKIWNKQKETNVQWITRGDGNWNSNEFTENFPIDTTGMTEQHKVEENDIAVRCFTIGGSPGKELPKEREVTIDYQEPEITVSSTNYNKKEGNLYNLTFYVQDNFDVESCSVKYLNDTDQDGTHEEYDCPQCSCETIAPNQPGDTQIETQCELYLAQEMDATECGGEQKGSECHNKFKITCTDENANEISADVSVANGESSLNITFPNEIFAALIRLTGNYGIATTEPGYIEPKNASTKVVYKESNNVYYTNSEVNDLEFHIMGNYNIDETCVMYLRDPDDPDGTELGTSWYDQVHYPSTITSIVGESTPTDKKFYLSTTSDEIKLKEDGHYLFRVICGIPENYDNLQAEGGTLNDLTEDSPLP